MHVVGYYWTLLESMHDRCMHTDRHVWILRMLKVKMKSRQVPHASNTFHLLNHSPILYMELRAPQWTKQADPEHVVWSLCQHMPYLSKLWERTHEIYSNIMHVRHGCTKKICPRITWKGNRRRCSRHRGCWGGSAAEASSFEPFDAFQLGLIHAWLLFFIFYICMQMASLLFFSQEGGGIRCPDLLINAACWTSHRIHSHQVQASFKSLFGHDCPRKYRLRILQLCPIWTRSADLPRH